MWVGTRVLLLVALGLLAGPSVAKKKFNITVGYLPSLTGELRDRQGLTISGALSVALEELNNNSRNQTKNLLPDVEILLEWRDTKSDTMTATRLLTNMICSGVVAFFGPEGRCHTEAIIAQANNLPMISYKCADYQTSTLSNFARLDPSGAQATKSVISLLRYYRWNKFSILYEESWNAVALTLQNQAKKNNMTVNHQRPVIDVFKCCAERLTCCAPGSWYQIIQDTKNKTRIYVFLGSTDGLIDMMTAMDSQKLFAKGEYMVIFVDMMSYAPEEALKYITKTEDRISNLLVCPYTTEFKKRAQSLLVVVPSEPTSAYGEFTDRVRKYNTRPPFNIPDIFANRFNKFVSIYAAYLYDSVILYATALDEIIQEQTTKEQLTQVKLISIARNGSRIIEKMIKNSPYKSISGMSIRLDEQAESEGHFSVLAFKPSKFSNGEINCSYSMIPVGHFHHSSKEFPEYEPRVPFDWPDNVKPDDEPSCGFL